MQPSSDMNIIGSFVSPFVRKVLACLELKGLDYRVDPISPFFGNDAFTRLNPKRQVPVLLMGQETVCGSAAICEVIDRMKPSPPLLPDDAHLRRQALEWQAYADGRLADLIVFGLFQETIIKPFIWGQARDDERIAGLREHALPAELDRLEASLPEHGFLFGALGLADIAVASFFRTAQLVRYEVDAVRWPRTSAYLERVLGHRAFSVLQGWEDLSMGTPYQQHREMLARAGAPLTEETLGTDTPRPPPPR